MTRTECASPASPNGLATHDVSWRHDLVTEGRGDAHDRFEHLLAHGTVVAALPSRSGHWTPEKRLAGAILATALIEIRDHHTDRGHQKRVLENLDWIASDECEWPFSFVRLCQLFDLEPSWVRAMVRRWVARGRSAVWRDAISAVGAVAAPPTIHARRTIHAAIA